MPLTLSSLHIYPVKSAGGISLERWSVDAFGPRYDRRWMVTDVHGTFISQRDEPRMALIGASLGDGVLELSSEGAGAIELPLEPGTRARCAVRVWRDTVEAEPCGAAADAWLTEVLERPVRLVRMPDDSFRQIDRGYAEEGERTAFTDAFPFLLIGSASLDDLNGRMAEPLPMNRFRPNLVVSGSTPFEEDTWSIIAIGDVELRVVKPCARCVVTTTDQRTGARGVEPLQTLATYRRRDGKVLFGQNLVHQGPGSLRVGDPVRVIARRSVWYL